MKRIPSLDGFRAVSILLVLFCHSRLSSGFPSQLVVVAKQGEVGVTIFFVISGFLITHLLMTEESKNGNINIGAFYIRRVLRIIPVYVLYLLFILLWRNFESMGVNRGNIIHALTFTVNFDSQKNWFLGHFWSVSVEEQFYLFWPAFVILFRKNLKVILCLLIAYSCLARVIAFKFAALELVTLSPFFEYAGAVFIGALGGIIFFEQPQILKHSIFRSSLAQLTALAIFVMFVYFTENGKLALISLPFGNVIISLSVLFLIFAYVTPSHQFMFKILNHKAVVHIGVLSYSIYIWQQFFFVGAITGWWRAFPYNLTVIYIVSLGSYYFWERPFLKLKKRFTPRKLALVV